MGCPSWRASDALPDPWDFPVALAVPAVGSLEEPLEAPAGFPEACWDFAFQSLAAA